MNERQIAMIQDSFAKVMPIQEAAGRIFYDRLFAIAPATRALFKGDIEVQGRKLIAMLAVLVADLHDLDRILPAAERLAIDHAGYGVEPPDYESVGNALIYTLEQGLGDAFTMDLREAWVTAYAVLSTAMISAAYGEGRAA